MAPREMPTVILPHSPRGEGTLRRLSGTPLQGPTSGGHEDCWRRRAGFHTPTPPKEMDRQDEGTGAQSDRAGAIQIAPPDTKERGRGPASTRSPNTVTRTRPRVAPSTVTSGSRRHRGAAPYWRPTGGPQDKATGVPAHGPGGAGVVWGHRKRWREESRVSRTNATRAYDPDWLSTTKPLAFREQRERPSELRGEKSIR